MVGVLAIVQSVFNDHAITEVGKDHIVNGTSAIINKIARQLVFSAKRYNTHTRPTLVFMILAINCLEEGYSRPCTTRMCDLKATIERNQPFVSRLILTQFSGPRSKNV